MKILCLLLTLVTLSAHAAGNGVGNGGDSLRDLFEKARAAASVTVENLNRCSFGIGARRELADWIMSNQEKIAADIRKSAHLWVVDAQPTCAFTQTREESPIYLSYPTCASTVGTDLSNALFVILHETAHHLGIADELAADEFARAIGSADINAQCSQVITNPFDSGICRSSAFTERDALHYLAPGSTFAEVGEYRAFMRIRECTTLAGCGAWYDSPIERASVTNRNSGYKYRVSDSPKLTLFTTNSPPHFIFQIAQNAGSPSISKMVLFGGDPAESMFSSGYLYLPVGIESAYLERSSMRGFSGGLYRDCGWFYRKAITTRDVNGAFKEIEQVIYGVN